MRQLYLLDSCLMNPGVTYKKSKQNYSSLFNRQPGKSSGRDPEFVIFSCESPCTYSSCVWYFITRTSGNNALEIIINLSAKYVYFGEDTNLK